MNEISELNDIVRKGAMKDWVRGRGFAALLW